VRDFYFLPLTSSLLLKNAGFFEVIGKREEVRSEVYCANVVSLLYLIKESLSSSSLISSGSYLLRVYWVLKSFSKAFSILIA